MQVIIKALEQGRAGAGRVGVPTTASVATLYFKFNFS